MAIIGLGRKGFARLKHSAYLVTLHVEIFCRCLHDGAVAQTYVDNLPFAHKLGVVTKEKRQTRKLNGHRESGVNHIAAYDAGVPFAKHARWDVDGYDRGTRLADVAGQHHEPTLERVAQTRAEKTVDNEVVGRERGSSARSIISISPL